MKMKEVGAIFQKQTTLMSRRTALSVRRQPLHTNMEEPEHEHCLQNKEISQYQTHFRYYSPALLHLQASVLRQPEGTGIIKLRDYQQGREESASSE